jgi:glycosyltransferase involved in cell wall biosynthesis
MRISFLLPGRSAGPSGGYQVVYEYADRLARNGHRVSVVHPWSCEPPSGIRNALRARLWAAWHRTRRGSLVPWLKVGSEVALRAVAYPGPGAFGDADAVIATAWQTARWVVEASRDRGNGYYLIQGYETWDDAQAVRASWRLPLQKIVISGWLEEIADEMGEGPRTRLVRNGVDFERFGVDIPAAERPVRVGALLSPFKRPDDVIAALSLARQRIPELTASTFGAGPRPDRLPEWVGYTRRPDFVALRALYNSCSVFLQASGEEGWGLPATESMACGCALVTYDNGGSREYAVNGSTAIVVSEHSPAALAEAIVGLAGDRELRLRLARQGRARVETFTWPRAVRELEEAIGAGGPAITNDDC